MKLTCPRCRKPLRKQTAAGSIHWACATCGGRTASLASLRKMAHPSAVKELWRKSENGRVPFDALRCPSCDKRMVQITLDMPARDLEVDVCRPCQFVWFDRGEMDDVPRRRDAQGHGSPVDPRVSREMAIAEVKLLQERAQNHGEGPPESIREWIIGFLGLPMMESRGFGLASRPVVTWLVGLLMIAMTLAGLVFDDVTPEAFGLVPANWSRFGGFTLVSSFFLHAGVLHLLGNLYFLLLFGDEVEDLLGPWKFAGLLFLSALAGDVAHILANPASTEPCVGASGGISGVITFFALQNPRRPVHILVTVFRFGYLRWVTLPAAGMFVLWVFYQIGGALMQWDGMTDVSYLSHLGGAATGLILWLVQLKVSAALRR